MRGIPSHRQEDKQQQQQHTVLFDKTNTEWRGGGGGGGGGECVENGRAYWATVSSGVSNEGLNQFSFIVYHSSKFSFSLSLSLSLSLCFTLTYSQRHLPSSPLLSLSL